MSKLQACIKLTRIDRPIGIFLVGWPMLWSLWLAAGGLPDMHILLVFLLGCVAMRSAGCAINDFADRKIDGHVQRTSSRPLATGELKPVEALAVFGLLCLFAFALVLTLNRLTIQLSFVAAGLAALYPFTKRWTHWPQLFLGLAFAWAVPMAFAAQTGQVPSAAWWILAAATVWALIYDSMYALVDRDDDLKIGVKSTVVLWGQNDRTFIGVFQAIMLVLLIIAGGAFGMGWVYFLGLAIASGVGVYHQWLIRLRDRDACFRAFLHNNWLGASIFAGIALDLFRQGI